MAAILFLAIAAVLHLVLLALVRRDGTLTRLEACAAALTFQFHFWTALSLALGFAGHFRLPFLLAIGALVALGGAVVLRGRLAPDLPDFKAVAGELRWPAWVMLALGLSAALAFLALGVRLPVVDYDGLSYHLGLAVHLFQDGDFRHYPYESIMTSHFSRGVELLMAISIMLAGSITLVNAVQWLVLPPLCLSVYTSARALGCDRSHAVLASMIPLLTPVILYQSGIAYADLFSGGWFAIALCAVLGGCAAERPGPARLLWMFSAAGLALAAKANAGILAGLTGFTAVILWGPGAFLAPTRRCLGAAAAGFLLSASVGLPWMIHNWTTFGSPLYPFELKPAGIELGTGPIALANIRAMAEGELMQRPLLDKVWESWTTIDLASWSKVGPFGSRMAAAPLDVLFDYSFGYSGDAKFGGFGALWIFLGLPAMLAVLLLAALMKGLGPRTRLYRVALVVVPLAAFFLLVAPWWSRFTLFLPVFGGLAIAVLLQEATRWGRPVYTAILCVALAVAAFDWHAVMFQNRDWERLSRFGQPNDTPVHFFSAIDPAKPMYRAVRFVMDNARPGEVVSFRTPSEPLFTGYFANHNASVRLFPFPTFWPPPDTYNEEMLADEIPRQRIALLLVNAQAAPEFLARVADAGGHAVYQVPGYTVYEFPAHRTAR
jgi:hypothetical protein